MTKRDLEDLRTAVWALDEAITNYNASIADIEAITKGKVKFCLPISYVQVYSGLRNLCEALDVEVERIIDYGYVTDNAWYGNIRFKEVIEDEG